MTPFKDIKELNYSAMKCEKEYISLLAKICNNAFSNGAQKDEMLKKKLHIPPISTKPHDPGHNGCKGCDTATRTEKRICRCMYYYNRDGFLRACDTNKGCKFYKKWKNVGRIKIIEYEWPTEYVMPKMGGMDLILEDTDGEKYGTEVKPEYSKETVGRMVAEALSYTIETEYKPAIAVFENSKQREMIHNLRQERNSDWATIENYVRVFIISYKDKGKIAEFKIESFD